MRLPLREALGRKMTIEHFADIPDVVAGIATVIALAFLTVQIRSATAQMKADSRRNEIAQPYISSIVEYLDVARIFLACLANNAEIWCLDRINYLPTKRMSVEPLLLRPSRG